MYTVLTIVHVVSALVMISVILLQQGKGADMGAVFGGSSQTLFGSSGAGNFLTRTTAAVAAVFFVTSLALAYGSARRVTTTIFDDAPLTGQDDTAPAPEGAPPAAPAPQAAAPVAEGNAAVVVETEGVVAVVKTGEAAEAAAAGAAEKVEEGAKAAAADVEGAAKKAEDKAEAVVGGEAKEAPGQVDPIPPVAAP